MKKEIELLKSEIEKLKLEIELLKLQKQDVVFPLNPYPYVSDGTSNTSIIFTLTN